MFKADRKMKLFLKYIWFSVKRFKKDWKWYKKSTPIKMGFECYTNPLFWMPYPDCRKVIFDPKNYGVVTFRTKK